MIKKIIGKYIIKKSRKVVEKSDEIKIINGKQLCFLQKNIQAEKLSDIEFKVFSQWGEDGILEYITSKIPLKNKFFIEFGVENYNESNTRFLMMNKNWGGLVIDGTKENINYIKDRDYFWKYDLTAINSFITKENINTIISNTINKLNIDKNIGLLSVDIDGVDYWVLNNIDCINPSIIICEYNSLFGNTQPLTVPYDKDFIRENYHYSNLYWGANLKAFNDLLTKKGYIYIGSNLQNSNAFFIQKPLAEKYLSNLLDNIEPFEVSKIRESRNKEGVLTYLRDKERLELIKDLELVNINTNNKIKIKKL